MKSLKCVRKPHPHRATHVFSKLSFLPIMEAYSHYFTVLGDRMMPPWEISDLCFSKIPPQIKFHKIVINLDFLYLIHSACLTLAKEMCKKPAGTCTGYKVRWQLQSSLLEKILWRNLLWKAELGPAAIVLNSFMLFWVLWCVKSS